VAREHDGRCCHYYGLYVPSPIIRSALETSWPWGHYGAIETFYPCCSASTPAQPALETNDCEFTGPQGNSEPEIPKRSAVLALDAALSRDRAEHGRSIGNLSQACLHSNLAELDEAFVWGLVGTTLVPTRYLALPESDDQQLGNQLMISFWAWGDSGLTRC